MLIEQTVEKLKEMHLKTMADKFQEIIGGSAYDELSFEDKMALIVDSEYIHRKNNHLDRLFKSAGFDIPTASVENIKYSKDRHLNKELICKLALCNYIQESRNILLLGATGVGKSYIACALGNSAVRNFYSVKYIRLTELFMELDEAREQRKYKQVLRKYQKVRLLIIDEWLTFGISLENAHDLLEIFNGRYQKGSTILCTQFEVAGWYAKIGDPTYADAILDRIVHIAYTIKIDGESMRRLEGEKMMLND